MKTVQTIDVIAAGTMGVGIAHVCGTSCSR
jgi:3-hydroxyacyl-CoA dehydrogenase